jgi:acyl-coenzyme A thioesterase PaaI-like protein
MRYIEDKENYRFIPTNIWDKHCFGCSSVNPAGLQMKFYTDEKSMYSWLKVPDHLCGWNRLVHGGVISTILDEVMGWAAIHLLKLIVLTKTMTVDYIQPVFVADELKTKGWITKFDNDGEVIIDATIHNGKDELCARSTGVFSYFPPARIKEMGIMDDESLKEFEKFMEE